MLPSAQDIRKHRKGDSDITSLTRLMDSCGWREATVLHRAGFRRKTDCDVAGEAQQAVVPSPSRRKKKRPDEDAEDDPMTVPEQPVASHDANEAPVVVVAYVGLYVLAPGEPEQMLNEGMETAGALVWSGPGAAQACQNAAAAFPQEAYNRDEPGQPSRTTGMNQASRHSSLHQIGLGRLRSNLDQVLFRLLVQGSNQH